jgi:P-type E1-E2 ATPase
MGPRDPGGAGIRRTILLTGDNVANAKRVARLGFTEYHAEVSPEEKAALVQNLKDEGRRVAMVGDGINDAPALANADVGISFEHGTDLARETADVLILQPDLRALPLAIRLSRLAAARVQTNFTHLVTVNSSLIGAALLGTTLPAVSARAHNLTTVFASVRSLRPYLPGVRTLAL